MHTPEEYLAITNRTLSEIAYPQWLPGLYEPIRYAMSAGGKRVRPTLLLAVNEAFGGEIDQCVWPAAGIEMFHNFTLVHDDVMDHADTRRGRPTVYKKWGLDTAILSGDAMVTMAYKCMSGCPPMFLPEVIERFGAMTMQVYEGQQLDAEMEHSDRVTFDEYLRMVMGKTSALIAYPCAIGAIIAGAQPADIEAIFNYGISLGIAFQMQDDYLDVYGDPATFGKAIGGDILNDKKTWLYIMAMERDPEKRLEKIIASGISGQEKIQAVTDLYNALGLDRAGEQFVARYTDDACSFLEETSMPAPAKAWLADFAHSLVRRKK